MLLKRLLSTAPVAVALALIVFVIGSESPAPNSAQVAELIDPSAAITDSVPPPKPAAVATESPVPLSIPTLLATPSRAPTPTSTREPSLRVMNVPILMYHYISVPPPDADIYRLDLSVTPANFQAQMEYLATEGYHPIRLSDLTDYLLTGKPLPPKPIVLTFDDGYADNFENALPILGKFKFTATFFIITQFIDDKRFGYMNWNQVEELAIDGMEIGSHTLDHIDLKGKPLAVQNTEIAGSKAMIEARIGTPVQSFCYPSGKYDLRTIEILRSAGYLAATTEIAGTQQSSNDMYQMRRIRVRGSYSVSEFAYWIKYFMASGK
ncbi:MAG: polysaccharide deacetylase family protein [Chloroflexota bacterium]|nr:polysaccharide deacetylase family protein [Chloroflexota bacterium]